jgi:hypothetical protein
LGSYLGLIYEEVKLRPNYIILESTKRNNFHNVNISYLITKLN